MASSYVLPASAITHSHSHHGHSHSHSPSRQTANTPRSMRQERSNGSLHAQSVSESYLGHINEHAHSHNHGHEHNHGQLQGHKHDREPSPSPFAKSTPYFESVEFPAASPYDDPFGMIKDIAAPQPSYESPMASIHVGHSHSIASPEPRSQFTGFVLPYVLRWPLIHTIMADKDSRRIFYFMSLNFAFMLVQASYGFLTDSLGLLSDSIHMFFDCLALAVGLFAAVASKWPPSERFPYGFGKIETLSGFGNGVFLMLISIEIMTEATERLAEGRETKRLMELFLVSCMGLAVNLVGMACFGHHGHAGHDHGSHSHGHSHDHVHEEKHEEHHHSHDHDCNHSHSHSHESHDHTPKIIPTNHSHGGHSHSHDNENMYGIWLHVLADTMGSAAVIVSTALIYFTGWNGWDPLASCVIAILIFMSSIPLIKSCARKLLLTIPDAIEYSLRDALSGITELRGVASYSVPRFWLGDSTIAAIEEKEGVLGVIHVFATRGSDLEEVRERTRAHLAGYGVDAVVQVEKDGDTGCWCGGTAGRSPPTRFS